MSTTRANTITCTRCQSSQTVSEVESANADRHPTYHAQVLERRFMGFPCAACGATLVVERELLYSELSRGIFVAVFPRDRRPDAAALEGLVADLYRGSFLTDAPEIVRRSADNVRPRLVFGYEELREKLVIADARLDDGLVEALKLLVIEEAGWGPAEGLLLDGVTADGALVLVRRVPDGVEPSEVSAYAAAYAVDRVAYDTLAADRARVAQLLAPLFTGPYVNVDRCRAEAPALEV